MPHFADRPSGPAGSGRQLLPRHFLRQKHGFPHVNGHARLQLVAAFAGHGAVAGPDTGCCQ